MGNKASLEKAIEVFVLITLPVALIVGCEGTLKQRVEVDRTDVSKAIEQSYDLKDIYPLFSSDGDNMAVNEIIQRSDLTKEQAASKELTNPVVLETEMVKPETILVESTHEQIQNSMMDISFEKSVSSEAGEETQAQSAKNHGLLKVADNSLDVLTAGANSSLAYVDNVELQPTYLVFSFDTDDASVNGYDHYYLRQHASYLTGNPNLMLIVSGHTDSRGSRIYNEELSRRRAKAIVDMLVDFGAPESQIQLKALGELLPVVDANDSEKNRRVELYYIDNTLISAK